MTTEKVPPVDVAGLTKNLGRTDVSDLCPGEGKRLRLRKGTSRRLKQSKRRVLATLSNLIDSNSSKYQGWMDRVAEENPGKALALTIGLLEYVAPKLGRVEQTGEVKHTVAHFVPVVEREERPKNLTQNGDVIEGAFTPVDRP